MKLLKKIKKGFTLVELVVVIAVIAIISGVEITFALSFIIASHSTCPKHSELPYTLDKNSFLLLLISCNFLFNDSDEPLFSLLFLLNEYKVNLKHPEQIFRIKYLVFFINKI